MICYSCSITGGGETQEREGKRNETKRNGSEKEGAGEEDDDKCASRSRPMALRIICNSFTYIYY